MSINIKKLTCTASALAAMTMLVSPWVSAVESNLWKQFKNAKEQGKEPTLPDFSYAGYEYSEKPKPSTSGWKVFKVKDYGAVTGDGNYDDKGIQDAINAAERHTENIDPSDLSKGAIVQFESGQYRVAPKEGVHPEQQITIEGHNIVLRGKGTGSNGTTIYIANHMARNDYCGVGGGDHCTGIPMFSFKFPENKRSRDIRSNFAADARRETFTVTVDDADKFKVGQRVRLWLLGSKELFEDQIGNRTPHKEWETTIKNGMTVREIHTIRKISGNKITFRAPIRITLKTAYNIPGERTVQLRSVDLIENVGVENIRFAGNWNRYLEARNEKFQHHKSDDPVHDYGWNALKMDEVFNGWVDRVEFKNLNISLSIKASAAITVSNVRFTGEKGHASIGIADSTSILTKDAVDLAGHHHGFASSQRTAGTVYLRSNMQPGQRADFHASGPYASLHDSMKGGHVSGNGGHLFVHPHHMSHYVSWNFEMRGSLVDTYDFWPRTRYERGIRNSHVFLNPYFVGLHGENVTLLPHSVARNESQGTKVEPGSLFEAQLGLRRLPGFKYLRPEGGEREFNQRVDVAYGTEGKYNFVYNKRGVVKFNNATFGDPVPGKKKVVYYRPAAPKGYFLDAKEGEKVYIATLRNVAYGADGNYVYKVNQQSTFDCSNATFGSDPAPRTAKACYIQRLNTPHNFNFSANEGGSVNVRGRTNIAFGANGQYIFKYNVRSNVACTAEAFGGDPKPGVRKKCYSRASTGS